MRIIGVLAVVGICWWLWPAVLTFGLGLVVLFLIIMSIVTVDPDRAVTRPWQ